MSHALGPSPELIAALNTAVARRAETGWPSADSARAGLAVIEKDAAAASGEGSDRLDRLVRHFGLGDAERAVLEVAAAAEHTTALHLLVGLLSGDDRPARPTVALALELAGVPATAATARELFGSLSPLVAFGLLEPRGEDVLLSRRVSVAERVAAYLAGDDRPTAEVRAMLLETVPVDVEGTATVTDALSAGSSFIWITGPVGSAGAAMAAAACLRMDVPCLVADLRLRPAHVSPDEAAAALILESAIGGGVLVLAGAEQASQTALDRSPLPVVAVSAEPWDPSRAPTLPTTVTAPRLTLAQRAELWHSALGQEVDREVTALRLAPEQILSVGRQARRLAELHGEDEVGLGRIRAAARQLGKGRAVRANPDSAVTIEDLVLPAHALAEVRRLLDWARYRDEVVARGPLHGKGGKGTGIAALFTGPPGTGKTLAAHVIADSLAMDLYQVELATVVDKYIGETEKNLEKVFQEAEAMNALLFFDEADALFGSRSEVRDARDRYANQEVAYLLQRMEQFDGITVLASNLRGNLDPAFARRLHFIVSFPDPDQPTREELWHHHLAGVGELDPADPVDVAQLAATVELAGGDIRNIVLSATYAAVAADEAVGMRHVRAAVRREFIKLGRRVPAAHIDNDQ